MTDQPQRVPGRLCLECEHCYVDYEGDWSSETPGRGFTMGCFRSRDEGANWWSVDGREAEKGQVLADIRRAETCPLFERDPSVGGKP